MPLLLSSLRLYLTSSLFRNSRAFNSRASCSGENDISRKYALTISLSLDVSREGNSNGQIYTSRNRRYNILLRVRAATTILRSFRVHAKLVNRIRSDELTDTSEKKREKKRQKRSFRRFAFVKLAAVVVHDSGKFTLLHRCYIDAREAGRG